MATERGPIGFGDFLPRDPAADWNADPYMPPRFSILNSLTSEDTPLFWDILGSPLPALPHSWPIGEKIPTSSSEILPDTPSVQAVEQGTLPAAPVFSNIWPRTAQLSPDNGARNCGSYKGSTGAKLWITDDQYSSAVAHTIPPPVSSLPLNQSFPLGWLKIPQRDYDIGRKQRSFKPFEPIFFSTNGRPGMNLRDALQKEFTGLDGRDDPMLQGAAGAISCRLLFPGYPDNGSRCQIHALNWTRNREPIPRSKLAHEVARKLERYLSRMTRITPDASGEGRWRIGEGFMKIENMFLVRLVSVSTGSVQPEIWVADPSALRHAGRW